MTRFSNRTLIGALIALCVIACLASRPAHSQTPTFTFGVSGTSSDGRTIAPTITWATTPSATSCTASATPAKGDWTGTKTGGGSSQLTSVSVTTSFQLVCTWPGDSTALVSWAKPTLNEDGSALTNLAGFRVQWGQVSGDQNMGSTVYLNDPTKTSWRSPALSPAGPWFFGVKAFNALGIESSLSAVVTKTTTAAVSLTRSADIVIRIPAPPSSVTVE